MSEPPTTRTREVAADPASPWQRTAAPGAAQPRVTHRMEERLRERRRTERRRAWARRGRWAAIAAAVAALGWAVAASPLFAFDAEEVELTGVAGAIDGAQIDQIVGGHDGESMFVLDAGALASRLEALPAVREASVARVWPSGLRVDLVAREPVAAIPLEDGTFSLVDVEAVEVVRADQRPPAVPVVTVPMSGDNERILAAVLEAVRHLPEEVRDRVGEVGAATEDSVTITLVDGPRIEWGGAEDSALKAQVLVLMLDSPEARGAAVIDVSAPTLPITRDTGDEG